MIDKVVDFIMGAFIVFGIVLIFGSPFALYISLGKQAELINAEFGTEYTRSDMFFTGETIKTMVEGQRVRVALESEE